MVDDPRRFPFTRARLDAEPTPASGRSILWDSAVGGLCCRITSTGSRTLWLSRWAKKGQRWIKLGDHPETTVKDARQRARELLADIGRGGTPWTAKRELREQATLADLWDAFRTQADGRKRPSSIREDESLWRTVVAPWAGKRRIGDITRAEVARLVNAKGRKTPVRANRSLALLSAMFSHGIRSGLWAGDNPCVGVERFRERSRERFLSPDELRAVFAALDDEPEAWRVFFLAAVLCGARRSNLLAMAWADLDLDRGLWRIAGEASKSGDPLAVVLPAQLVETLRAWRSRCSSPRWCFPGEGASGHVTDPASAWTRVRSTAEAYRLLHLLAVIESWDADRERDERNLVIEHIGRLRLRALGRHPDASGDPWADTIAALRERVTAAGGDGSGPGILTVRMHDLRRTLGSWMALSGNSLPVIGRALGHRSTGATAIYARLTNDPVREAVQGVADKMLGGNHAEA